MAVQAWRDDALCVGLPSEVFFPETMTNNRFDAALKVCAKCKVQIQCLRLVIGLDDVDDRWGVFGGTTPRQRRVIRYELEKGMSLADAVSVGVNVKR
jgi:WhiB family redox-sensing transcriptional regulator